MLTFALATEYVSLNSAEVRQSMNPFIFGIIVQCALIKQMQTCHIHVPPFTSVPCTNITNQPLQLWQNRRQKIFF